MTEDQIHKSIVSYLRRVLPADHILMHARNEGNRGGRKGYIDGARGKAMGVQPGWPDLLIYVDGHGYAIEVKKPGENLSDFQKEVARQLERHGIPHAVCRSIDDARTVLSCWGVRIREKAA